MKKRIEKVENIFASGKTISKRFLTVLFVVLVVVLGSVMYFVQFSNRRTSDAVYKVSEFYLEELASNVSCVFKTHFDGYFKELRLAIIATKEARLQNAGELQTHMISMAERGGFLYYALLDEDGRVYISDESFRTKQLVDFFLESDYSEDVVMIDRSMNSENIFVIATAVEDLTLNGKKIIAGAKGISQKKVKEEVLLRDEEVKNIAHMIRSDGMYVIAGDNSDLVMSDNIFSDLAAAAKFSTGYSLEKMREDIDEGKNGNTVYQVNGVLRYAYYMLLPRSGWYVMVTIEDEAVSSMLRESTKDVVLGGLFLMVVIGAVVSVVFYSYYQQKKTSIVLNLAKLEAEERNRAKSSFLSSMSHDIRTPMNAIIGFTNLAIQQESNERVQDYLKKIRTSSNHLLSLINDVLDMSRIESGKMHIEEIPCSLANIFHGLHTIIQGQVQSKQQHLYVDVVDVVHEDVWCDQMKLNQMLLNFLGNAVKFTPAGGAVFITVIEQESRKPGYGAYEFRVKDTGIGMSPEFSKKVFEPFEREKSSTVNNIQGTGLGMSIAKSIVDMMDGSVRVETELGKGTEFIVNLNLKLQDDTEQVEPFTFGQFNGMRVLVIDDEFSACESVIRMLRKFGMDVEWSRSEETVETIRRSMKEECPYQMYVLNWQLHDQNGLQVIKDIRGLASKETPVVMISSYGLDDLKEEAVAAGVTEFCSKPIFMSDLYRLLKILFEEAEEQTASSEDESIECFIGKRILLVDDNELNREIAIEILQEFGFEMEAAVNGKEAYEKVRDSRPGHYDVVLMDVQMPVMNGYEASKAIRKLSNPELSNVPIFAMTANAFEEDKQDAMAAGMNGHIAKPIDINKLLGALKGILHK